LAPATRERHRRRGVDLLLGADADRDDRFAERDDQDQPALQRAVGEGRADEQTARDCRRDPQPDDRLAQVELVTAGEDEQRDVHGPHHGVHSSA
jgi:hypothetical protein